MFKVISTPTRFLVVSAMVFISVPIVSLQVMLLARTDFWVIPLRKVFYGGGISFLLSFVAFVLITRQKRWIYWGLAAIAFAWCLVSIYLSLTEKSFWAGALTLGLMGYWLALLTMLRREMGRSYLDPKTRWYQGLPSPVPHLKCALISGDRRASFRVARMDTEGAFLFGKNDVRPGDLVQSRDRIELVFEFEGRRVQCHGIPVGMWHGGEGLGVRFASIGGDGRKELAEFVRGLEGGGYVQVF